MAASTWIFVPGLTEKLSEHNRQKCCFCLLKTESKQNSCSHFLLKACLKAFPMKDIDLELQYS